MPVGILDGKVALVTGAGKGLGKSEARALAREGAQVAVLARTFADVEYTASEIRQLGGRALALQCDVCVREQVERSVETTLREFGAVDILVNNAQIIYPAHPLESWTEMEMRNSYESGLLGSWFFMVACFPYMKRKGGRIINFCSGAGHGVLNGYAGYAAAKEAIRSLSRTAAREWGQYRINVNVISPAGVSEFIKLNFPTDEQQQEIFRTAGVVRPLVADPEKSIGRAVVYLAGPDAEQITGCTLSVDGGCAML